MTWTGTIFILLLAAGCDEAMYEQVQDVGSESVAADAAPTDSAAESHSEIPAFDVVVGTGRQTFVPLNGKDTLYLEQGSQGLQHVLVSIRIDGLPQARYAVDFSLVRNDGVAVSEPAWVKVPFASQSDGIGVELLGYQLVVADPALGVEQDGVLRIEVEGPDGTRGSDERAVHIAWAPVGWEPDG